MHKKYQSYETVIGLEVHVELATRTKIFCSCSTAFGAGPNTQVCPVCMGMPGALPVFNEKVLEYAIAAGLALHCRISPITPFDRKNYFYPDNPQNYQISQLYVPLCHDGYVELDTTDEASGQKKRIRIHEIHMEEDAGKLNHDIINGNSLVDYNRSGVPLIEIVTEPDMRNAEEVIAFLENLQCLLQYLGVSDCKLQEGSMRADVNLSVRKKGSEIMGTRTEMKNLASFTAIKKAIAKESIRQIDLLEEGLLVVQETRRFDEDKEETFSMRSKEDANDYRYFPEPDLPPVVVSEKLLARIRQSQPEFRDAKRIRYAKEYQLPAYDIEQITASKPLADFFEATVALGAPAKKVSNWIMVETMRLLRENNMEAGELRISPANLAKLIRLTEARTINSTVAKEVFEKMFSSDIDPAEYVEQEGLGMVADEGQLEQVVHKVLHEHPKSVEDYLGGKEKAIGYLVGMAMKESKGKADPGILTGLLKDSLEKMKTDNIS